MNRYRNLLGAAATALLFSAGCAGTYVIEEPPPPQVEVRPLAPGPLALWIDGHWARSHGRYVWVAGHWERNAKGEWVPGHWDHRPRGYVWVAGHWHR